MRADDRGSALLLAPAAVLGVLALAALAADTAAAHLGHRRLAAAAEAAASDAAARAVDEAALRAGHGIRPDPARAHAVVAASVAAHRLGPALAAPPRVEVGPGGEVTVELAADVATLFAPVVGGRRSARVVATATAVAARR